MAVVDSPHESSVTVTALSVVRRRKLMSQRELAEKAKVSASTVYMVEAGKTKPRYRIVRALSEALGVEASEVDEFRAVLEDPDWQQAAAA